MDEQKEAAALATMVRGGGSTLMAEAAKVRAADPAMQTPEGQSTSTEATSREGTPSSRSPAASVPVEPLSPAGEPTPAQKAEALRAIRVKIGESEEEIPVDELGGLVERARSSDAILQEAKRLETNGLAGMGFVKWVNDPNIPNQVKEHVMQAIKLNAIPQTAESEVDMDDEAETPAPRSKGKSDKISELERTVAMLQERENQRIVAEMTAQRERTLGELMGKHDVFGDKAVRDLAVNPIRNALNANPSADMKAVVQQHAAQYGAWVRSIGKQAQDAKPQGGARTASETKTGASSQPRFSAKDLLGGSLLAHAVQRAKELNR